ncbi:MAG: Tfp pilus assembly protein PilF [Rhodothermales bacterium]|jgi:Tfp pilus assembly protein PilF
MPSRSIAALHTHFRRLALIVPPLLALLVYAPALNGEFTNWDDHQLVKDNPAVLSLAPGAIAAICTPQPGATYQPVRVLSYAIDHVLWGFRPFGYHVINVLLHGCAAGLLILGLVSLLAKLRPKASERENQVAAMVVGLLFLLHPVNVESVAWISSRKYGLLAIFSAWALWAWGQTRHRQMIAATILAALSSPFGVALAPGLLLAELCANAGDWRQVLRAQRPLLVTAAALVLFFAWLLVFNEPADAGPVKERKVSLATLLAVPAGYAQNLAWPMALNNRYLDRPASSFVNPRVLLVLFGGLALIAFAVGELRKGRFLALFCVGWALLWWLPVSNIIPISTRMADRYLYLPCIGIFLGLVCVAQARIPRQPFLIAISAILLVCTGLSFRRAAIWKSSETLWADSLRSQPDSFLALGNYALVQQSSGDFTGAMTTFERALGLSPGNPILLNNIGFCHLKQNQHAEAIPRFEQAVAADPGYIDARVNLTDAITATGNFAACLPHHEILVQQSPDAANLWADYGDSLLRLSRFADSATMYQHAVDRGFYHPGVLLNMAIAQEHSGDKSGAMQTLLDAQQRFPTDTGIKAAIARLQ